MLVKNMILYPLKSVEGTHVDMLAIHREGLIGDRAFRIMRASNGKQINAKNEPRLTLTRAKFFGPVVTLGGNAMDVCAYIELTCPGFSYAGDLEENTEIDSMLTKFLGYEVALKGSWTERYPDDPTNPGPSIVSEATLMEVAQRFSLPYDEVLRRFRPNIVLSDCESFAEEKLVGKSFKIGSVTFEATHVCRRCAVPTRDSLSGTPFPNFVKDFMAWRATRPALPVGSEDGLYRLCVRTKILPASSATVTRLIHPQSAVTTL